jgi:quercetin dioxygenase-like cupin family protein
MTADEFSRSLRAQGFQELVTVEREPDGVLGLHSHPFESKALILDGEIRITVEGTATTYLPGDVFHLEHSQEHRESYGPQGVRYLVGRR